MSMFTKVETDMTDQDCILAALKDLRPTVKFRSSAEAQTVTGWGKAKAEIIIPKKAFGNSYAEMGFARQANGNFSLVAADHDKQGIDMKAVRRGYAEHRIIRTAKVQGMKFVRREQTKNAAGKVNIDLIFAAAGVSK